MEQPLPKLSPLPLPFPQLYTMLPKPVAIQLMQGEPVTSEKYEVITILFTDICGFTPLSAKSTPHQIVILLNELYTSFDRLVDQHDCYKVSGQGSRRYYVYKYYIAVG
jgi:class 3 adenylate cyclase